MTNRSLTSPFSKAQLLSARRSIPYAPWRARLSLQASALVEVFDPFALKHKMFCTTQRQLAFLYMKHTNAQHLLQVFSWQAKSLYIAALYSYPSPL